ncbi:hypothetical protein L218DRAFT_574666 [Marasmius fiardii PR-910]|nr:hypothetical protein L218DRAFT_574666 [Marasmius fiardii PR-910]
MSTLAWECIYLPFSGLLLQQFCMQSLIRGEHVVYLFLEYSGQPSAIDAICELISPMFFQTFSDGSLRPVLQSHLPNLNVTHFPRTPSCEEEGYSLLLTVSHI